MSPLNNVCAAATASIALAAKIAGNGKTGTYETLSSEPPIYTLGISVLGLAKISSKYVFLFVVSNPNAASLTYIMEPA